MEGTVRKRNFNFRTVIWIFFPAEYTIKLIGIHIKNPLSRVIEFHFRLHRDTLRVRNFWAKHSYTEHTLTGRSIKLIDPR